MKLAALGDSIIKGVIVKPEGNKVRYSLAEHSIVDRCAQGLNSEAINLGKMGCTIEAGEHILDKRLDKLGDTKYILLESGGNDSDYHWQAIAENPGAIHQPNTPLDRYINTYERIIKKIQNIGAVPLVLSLPPMDAERYFAFFSSQWREEWKENGMYWLGHSTNRIMSGYELYNMATWKIAQNTGAHWIDITSELLQQRQYNQYLCDDGIHPNEEGQARIADIILRTL